MAAYNSYYKSVVSKLKMSDLILSQNQSVDLTVHTTRSLLHSLSLVLSSQRLTTKKLPKTRQNLHGEKGHRYMPVGMWYC